ncbi:MAG: M6 family metalloprotease domain-containing protein [Eubacterium sp.]|nr:M6 family metalloprotease domain-containing protein [Eubacterium sp.]
MTIQNLKYWAGGFLLTLGLMLGAAAPAVAETTSPCVPSETAVQDYAQDGSYESRREFQEALELDQPSQALLEAAQIRSRGDYVPEGWQSGMATTGEAKILLLRVDFPDYQFSQEDTEAALANNAFGNNGNVPYESLAAYYERSSSGRLHISGETASYTAENPRDTYTNNMDLLFAEALEALDDTLDYSQFDGNGDGLIDGVYIHFAGGDTGWGSSWWSNKRNYGGADLDLDGKGLSACVTLHENQVLASASQTLIHETGHVLGLPDYYAYPADTGADGGIKTTDMMSNNIGDHNGFSKWLLGWLGEEEILKISGLQDTQRVQLAALSGDSPKIAVISPEDKGIFSEYFVVQYDEFGLNNARLDTAIDKGFRVYHVNAALDDAGENFKYNNDTSAAPKLIEYVTPAGDSSIYPNDTAFGAVYADGHRLTSQDDPGTSFWGGKYLANTGINLNNFNLDQKSFEVEITADRPELPELNFTLAETEKTVNNLPAIAFDVPTALEKNPQVKTPITLVSGDESYTMGCMVYGGTRVVFTMAEDMPAPVLSADTSYTLVIPEGTFRLSETETSGEMRLPVKTGEIAEILSQGELASALDFSEKTDWMALEDGRLVCFKAYLSGGAGRGLETAAGTYYNRVVLRVVGEENQLTDIDLSQLELPGGTTSMLAARCCDDTLVLGLCSSTSDTTRLYHLSSQGEILDAPVDLQGVYDDLFASGDGVSAAKLTKDASWNYTASVTRTDFKSEPVTIQHSSAGSALSFYPLNQGRYALAERIQEDLWTYKDYLTIYTAEGDVVSSHQLALPIHSELLGIFEDKEELRCFYRTNDYTSETVAGHGNASVEVCTARIGQDGALTDQRTAARVRFSTALNVLKVQQTDFGYAIQSGWYGATLVDTALGMDVRNSDFVFLNASGDRLSALGVRGGATGIGRKNGYFITTEDYDILKYVQTGDLSGAGPDDGSLPEDGETILGGLGSTVNVLTGVLGAYNGVFIAFGLLFAAGIAGIFYRLKH